MLRVFNLDVGMEIAYILIKGNIKFRGGKYVTKKSNRKRNQSEGWLAKP